MLPYQSEKDLYLDVFSGKTGYIPLLVWPVCHDMPTVDEMWADLPAALHKVPPAVEATPTFSLVS